MKLKRMLVPLIMLVAGLAVVLFPQTALAKPTVWLEFPNNVLYEEDIYLVKARLENQDKNETYSYQWQGGYENWSGSGWTWLNLNWTKPTPIFDFKSYEGQGSNNDTIFYRCRVTDSKGNKYYSDKFEIPHPVPKTSLDIIAFGPLQDLEYGERPPTTVLSWNEEQYVAEKLVWYKAKDNNYEHYKLKPDDRIEAGVYSCRAYIKPGTGYKVNPKANVGLFGANDRLRYDEAEGKYYISTVLNEVKEPIYLNKVELGGISDNVIKLAPGQTIVLGMKTNPINADKWYNLQLSPFAQQKAGYTVTPNVIKAGQPFPKTITITAGQKEGTYDLSAWINANVPQSYGTWKVQVVSDAPKTYTVNLKGSYSDTWTGSGDYHEGDVVVLNAGQRPGYIVDKWVSNDVTLNEADTVHPSFTMPAKNVEVEVQWKENKDSYTEVEVFCTPPKTGEIPRDATTTTEFSNVVSTQWNPVETPFKEATAYTATIGVKCREDHRFKVDTPFYVNGQRVVPTNISDNLVQLQVTFPKTEIDPNKPIEKQMFNDVKPSDYFYQPVQWAVTHNPIITSGTSATTFSPNKACTRAQAVTFLWRAAGEPEPPMYEKFIDVDLNAYYGKAVMWAVDQGIASGTGATTFSPEATCNRAQIVTFLWRQNGMPAVNGSNPFNDVPENAYYTPAVKWAVKEGVANGLSATKFGPEKECTRGQIVTFLYKANVKG